MGEARRWTWGGFLEYARPYGVAVEVLPNVRLPDGTMGPLHYLERTGSIGTLTHVLPMGWVPERRIGPIGLAKICRRLDIPKPDWLESEWLSQNPGPAAE